ncbi:MAG: DNA repair protein RecN [Bacteroidia bacterium]
MLQQLTIKNYAIIQWVQIRFDARLNIITGETGAGKSILMGALGLILGERADTKILLNASDKCVVEGVFKIDGYKLKSFFEIHELDYDAQCVIRREITPAGKSRSFINDTPVNLQQLRELGIQLVEIVSQHETLELNNKEFQLSMLDALAGNQSRLTSYKTVYENFIRTRQTLSKLEDQEQKARSEEDYFRFVLNELAELKPLENEQEELEKKLERLSHAENIREATYTSMQALNNEEQSVDDQLRHIRNTLATAGKHMPELNALALRLDAAMIELKDVASELNQIYQDVQADPEELNRIEERIQALFSMQKKHRVSDNTALINLQQKLEKELASLGSLQNEIEDRKFELEELTAKLTKQAGELHQFRLKAIPVLEKKVKELLKQVEMPNATLMVQMQQTDNPGSDGSDQVEWLFSANTGSEPKPLNKVASGGELSRLMLCIKSLLSDQVALPTIVFDEIDTGISGEAALKVARVMKQHASKHQVLAITHLPQIAGKADKHFVVIKSSDAHSTQVQIRSLNEEGRLSEVARMLHGDNPSAKVLDAARELIAN